MAVAAAGFAVGMLTLALVVSWWAHTTMVTEPTGPRHSEASRRSATTAAVVHSEGELPDVRTPGEAALIFTGGPVQGWTDSVLDVLADAESPATFFFEGITAARNPDLVRRAVREGHTVGLTGLAGEDLVRGEAGDIATRIERANALLAGVTGLQTRLLRPKGLSSPEIADEEELSIASIAGDSMMVVGADRSSRPPSVDSQTSDIILDAQPPAGPGTVIEFAAPASEAPDVIEQSPDALAILLPYLANHEWRVVPIDRFIDPAAMDQPMIPATDSTQRVGRVLGALASAGAHTEWLASHLSVLLGAATIALSSAALVGVWSFTRRRRVTKWVPDPPQVTVVIPAHDEESTLAQTLEAIGAAARTAPQIVVVDDGSTDRTVEVARSAANPDVEVVSIARSGKSAALNVGLERARNEIVVTLDADTRPAPASIDMLTEAMADPRLAAVAGALQLAGARGIMGRFQAMEFAMANGVFRRALACVGAQICVPGAFGAFRRDALVRIGGFSDRSAAEDTDATVTLQRMGWRIGFEPGARASTTAPANLQQFWHQRIRWSGGVLQVLSRSTLGNQAVGATRGALSATMMSHFALVAAFSLPADAMIAASLLAGTGNLAHPLMVVALALQVTLLAVAISTDDLPRSHLLLTPLYWLVYRPLLYLVLIRSGMMLLVRDRFGWTMRSRSSDSPAGEPRRSWRLAPPVRRRPSPTQLSRATEEPS